MEDQIAQIRTRYIMGDYSGESREDIGHLLSLLDRQAMQDPAALNYLRDCIDNKRYPALSDIRAIIDELRDTRQQRIADLEFILDTVNEHSVGTPIPRIVQGMLDRIQGARSDRLAELRRRISNVCQYDTDALIPPRATLRTINRMINRALGAEVANDES